MIEITKPVFGLIMLLLVALAGIMAWKATHNVKSKFSLTDAFLDKNGKTSFARIGQFSALTVSTWGFVYLVVDGKMSAWYFQGFMLTWVGNGLGHKWLDGVNKEPVKNQNKEA